MARRYLHQVSTHPLAHEAPNAISDDCFADFLAHGKAGPHLGSGASHDMKNEGRTREGPASSSGEPKFFRAPQPVGFAQHRLDRDAVTTFETAGLENGAASARRHSSPETVYTLPRNAFGLPGALHD